MEHLKGLSYLLKPTQLQEEGLRLPLVIDDSASGGTFPSKCRLKSVSIVLPNLVVALLLLSTALLMYNTNCSFSVLISKDDLSEARHSISAQGRDHSFGSSVSSTAAETMLHSRLRMAQHRPSMQSRATEVGPTINQEQPTHDHVDVAKISVSNQALPSRGLGQVEQMVQGRQRWPSSDFQQKTHPIPNGPDPIHNL